MHSPLAYDALHWIVPILVRRAIPFHVTGGLAAKVYGSPRPLNDIDLEVSDEMLHHFVPEVQPFLEFGPARHKDERWDLPLMVLNYRGQIIDISGADSVRICDARTGEWVHCPSDLSKAEWHSVFDLRIPVMDRVSLLSYKQMLQGEHQQIDIEAIQYSMAPMSQG